MTLVDYDDVELSNLHRQILHTERSLGLSKVMSAYNALIKYKSSGILICTSNYLLFQY